MESSPKLLFYRKQDQHKQKEQEKQLKIPRKNNCRNISIIVETKQKAKGRKNVATFKTFVATKIKNPWKTIKSCHDIYHKGNCLNKSEDKSVEEMSRQI